MNIQILQEVVTDILRNTPYRPFLCLPLSAILYATFKDKYNVNPEFVTGNLFYKKEYIFKRDFSISGSNEKIYQNWVAIVGWKWID